jgi:ribulose-phosphate 3-epimerase
MNLKISPSILSADFGKLNEEIAGIEPYCDMIHVDVMDGHFVPNISFGVPVMKWIKTKLPLDVHLMIENPGQYIEDFIKNGASRVIVHSEACDDLRGLLEDIRAFGAEAGASIKPNTPVSDIQNVLDILDEVLIMTVEPGFGGQKFMEEEVYKIKELRDLGFTADVAVDGGINAETAKICRDAGANLLIAGNYIFKSENREEAIASLRG